MLQPDTISDNVQAFRSVHESQKPSSTSAPLNSDDVTHINCYNEAGNAIILWEDIQDVYQEALFVKNMTN
ncbi:hypothetical protein EC991_007700, partial [Linnemannia zychae]